MQLRPLGQSDLRIAPLMLGGNVFGWNVDEPTSFALLDAFIDAGFNGIDTADTYSRWAPGHKGGEVGNRHRQLAEDEAASATSVVIATKIGNDMGEGKSLKKDYILRAAEACLKRLQVDCIDLLQTHFDDEVTPPEETLQAYAQLIAQGKVRVIGASNMDVARLKASLAASRRLGIPRYESLQPLYNLYDRKSFETDYAPICRQEKLGVITYFSLASGFLTGKYRSAADAAKSAARGGRMKGYLNERGLSILAALDEVAARHVRNAGAGRARLADRAARHHRADRQRHQHGAARRDAESAARSS